MKFLLISLSILLTACQLPQTQKKEHNPSNLVIEQVNSPVKTSIRGISVLDEKLAWLSGAKGTILRTTNGGKDWQKILPPDQDSLDFRDVAAFSENIAIVSSAGFPCRVYKTIDGGENWTLVYENLDSTAFINSIAFRNEKEGVILGDQINGRHLILTSDNQGDSWHQIDSGFIPQPLTIENGFAASGSCIAIDEKGAYFIGLGGEAVRVFSSTNGKTWTTTTTPMKSLSTSYGVYSIAHGNGKIIGVGGDYLTPDSSHFGILHDNDQWKLTEGKVNGYRSVIDYSEKGNFWVCGGTNGIDVSLDDGKVWEKVADHSINTLQFIPFSTQAIAANSKGEVFLLDFKMTNREN